MFVCVYVWTNPYHTCCLHILLNPHVPFPWHPLCAQLSYGCWTRNTTGYSGFSPSLPSATVLLTTSRTACVACPKRSDTQRAAVLPAAMPVPGDHRWPLRSFPLWCLRVYVYIYIYIIYIYIYICYIYIHYIHIYIYVIYIYIYIIYIYICYIYIYVYNIYSIIYIYI